VAAGALLVREAGGLVTDWLGNDRNWLDSGDIVVGPAGVHQTILELARASGPGGSATEPGDAGMGSGGRWAETVITKDYGVSDRRR